MLDWLFRDARLITPDPAGQTTASVFIEGGVIRTIGGRHSPPLQISTHTRVVDCQDRPLLPGFIDPHFHLLAFAKGFVILDLGMGQKIRCLRDLNEALRNWSRKQPPGNWLRARGYHEFDLAEQRHPTRWELDAAVPDHPLVLTHRSGGAHVLNTLALEKMEITSVTEDPREGIIDRDLDTGEPTGLLYHMDDWLARRMPPLNPKELAEGVRRANRMLCAWGITSLHDVSAQNDLPRWELIRTWQQEGILAPRVIMALGWQGFESFRQDPSPFSPTPRLRVGGVKLIIHETTGRLSPSPEELREKVLCIHRAGLPAIIHAIEEPAIEAACDAVAAAVAQLPGPRHRIEHCALCPPSLAQRIASLGMAVVTHPPFLYYHGDRYLQTVPEAQQRHLYPFRRLLQAGITVAGSSDAPVCPPNPLIGIQSAITRRTASGKVLLPEERLDAFQSLALYTTQASEALGNEAVSGLLSPGRPADLILLSADPTTAPDGDIGKIQVEMTIIDGEKVWERGRESALCPTPG